MSSARKQRQVDEAFCPVAELRLPRPFPCGQDHHGRGAVFKRREICKTELSKDPKNPVMEDNLVKLEQVYEEPVLLKYRRT